MSTTPFPKEIRQQALDDYANGIGATAVCEKYRINSTTTLYRWVDAAKPKSEFGLYQKEIDKLRIENEKLKAERNILLDAGCSKSSPREVRSAAFRRLCGKYQLKPLCRLLGLSYGAGHHLKRTQGIRTWFKQDDDRLRPMIRSIFEESRRTYGCVRISAALHRRGEKVSPAHVSRIMKEENLISVHKRYDLIYEEYKPKYYRDFVNREYAQSAPNIVWSADTTFIRGLDKWYYLCVIIDFYSRKIVDWSLSTEKTGEFMRLLFQRAYRERGNPQGLTFHTDQGCENTEFFFKHRIKASHVRQSFSRPGTPNDNAISESFFSIIKRELIRHRIFASETTLYAEIADYVDFYNNHRLHTALNMQTPAEVEAEYENECNKILD